MLVKEPRKLLRAGSDALPLVTYQRICVLVAGPAP
jgi:hypothetical protein